MTPLRVYKLPVNHNLRLCSDPIPGRIDITIFLLALPTPCILPAVFTHKFVPRITYVSTW